MAEQGDKTVREPAASSGGATVRETSSPAGGATVREGQAANATVREGPSVAARPAARKSSDFRGYAIRKQLPSNSTEADIYIMERDGAYYVLKLYRYGVEPKNDILQKIKALSQSYPHEFIRVFEADYDSRFKRWFEIQEYARYGTLQAFMERLANITDTQRANFVNLVAREVGQALSLLHQNELLHLDIKPSNILVRSPKWPYDLVLIDFGIATALSADMSKKFTQTRGTPMYQSPESWVGSMGRPSDWWGLGMILLEIAAGAHPFAGLNQNVIASAIATRPVAIPDKLDAGQKELIRGLLTRDPAKRWSWEQVSRWLKGERGIPQFFEAKEPAKVEAPASDVKPLVFMGQPCRSLAELAAAFAKDEEGWEKGKAFLMRGYVMRWLEDIGDFDASVDLESVLSGTEDTDEKTFRFVQQFGKDIPFAFGGHLITLQNLLLIAGKVLKREPATAIEQKIADSIADGRLLSNMQLFMKKAKATDETETLLAALRNLKDKSAGDVVVFLDFYLHPKDYYCPFVKDASSIKNVVMASAGLQCVPICMEQWKKINVGGIVPDVLIEKMKSAASYHEVSPHLMPNEMFMLAAQYDNPEAIKALLEHGVDVNMRIDDHTALMVAAKNNSVKAIKFLAEHGADLNAKTDDKRTEQLFEAARDANKDFDEIFKNSGTALMIAAANSSLEAVKMLLMCGADVDDKGKGMDSETALGRAVQYGTSKEIVNVLLENGANINAKDYTDRTPLFYSVQRKIYDCEIIQMLIAHGANINEKSSLFGTALNAAVGFNADSVDNVIDAITILLKAGADVNASSPTGTALTSAARKDAVGIMKLLIKAGANVNARDEILGDTILMAASKENAVEAMKILIENGASLNAKDKLIGRNALMAAAEGNASEAINLLLDKGMYVNGTGGLEEKTALMYAAENNSVDAIKVLLQRGANINATTLDILGGKTALAFAREKGAQDAVNLLMQYGAR